MPWQPTGIVFPDIELVLTGRYRAALAARSEPYAADVYVSNTRPSAEAWSKAHPDTPYPACMLVVRRDGGIQGELRDRPRVTHRIWAATEKDATDLARLAMALAPTFADGNPIISVPMLGRAGPTPVADESGQPLRLLNIEFHTRGVLA